MSSAGTKIGEARSSCTKVAKVKTVANRIQVRVDKLLGYNKRIIRDLSQSRTINLDSTTGDLDRISEEVSVSR